MNSTNSRAFPEVVPPVPTTEFLLDQIRLDSQGISSVSNFRDRLSARLNGGSQDLLAILGACSMPKLENRAEHDETQLRILANEEHETRELDQTDRLIAIQRLLPWKSRSEPKKSWNGLETTSPYVAQLIMTQAANHATGITMEIGQDHHVARYGHLLAMVWIGSRSLESAEAMALDLLAAQPSLPIGIKNGLDGEVEPAIRLVERLNQKYEHLGKVAFLIYRGGENAKDEESWEDMYKQTYDLTDGEFVVDVAHGAEMAHHPGYYVKSDIGQRKSLAHIIDLASQKLVPMGVMIEGSDLQRVVDPHIRFEEARDGVLELVKLAA